MISNSAPLYRKQLKTTFFQQGDGPVMDASLVLEIVVIDEAVRSLQSKVRYVFGVIPAGAEGKPAQPAF